MRISSGKRAFVRVAPLGDVASRKRLRKSRKRLARRARPARDTGA